MERRRLLKVVRSQGLQLTAGATDRILALQTQARLPPDLLPLFNTLDKDKLGLRDGVLDEAGVERILLRSSAATDAGSTPDTPTQGSMEGVKAIGVIDGFGSGVRWGVGKKLWAPALPDLPAPPAHASAASSIQTGEQMPRLSLHGAAGAKMEVFRQRLAIVQQRVLRNPLFLPPVLYGPQHDAHGGFTLTPIESLIGSSGRKYVLGILSQLEEGRTYLEDLDAHVLLDLSEAQYTEGLYAEGSVVICEGTVKPSADIFLVTYLGHPPPESRVVTLKTFPNVDFLGDGVLTDPLEVSRLEAWERSQTDQAHLDLMQIESPDLLYDVNSEDRRHWGPAMLVFSEVVLDESTTWAKLRQTLAGAIAQVKASGQTVAMIVFIGNFVSAEKSGALEAYVAGFEKLGDFLAPRQADLRSHTSPLVDPSIQLVFVPGPADMTASREILPRPGLIRPIRTALFARSSLSPLQVHFTTNPARIRFGTREVVIFREEISNRLRRLSLVKPKDDVPLIQHVAKTLVEQSHLSPMPIHSQPVFWAYDHALRLYPTPNIILLAENQHSQPVGLDVDCQVANTGAFHGQSAFLIVWPLAGPMGQVEQFAS